MKLSTKARKYEVYRDDAWVPIPMSDIKIGERFRVFELTGAPFKSLQGHTEFKCTKQAIIECDSIPFKPNIKL